MKWVPAAVCCLGLGLIYSFGCKRLSRQGTNSRICKKSHWKGRRATLTTTLKFSAGQTSSLQKCWIPQANPTSTQPSRQWLFQPAGWGQANSDIPAHSPRTARLKHRELNLSSYISTHSTPFSEKRNSNNHSPLTRTLFCHWESEHLRKAPIWSCSITHRGRCYNWALQSKRFYTQIGSSELQLHFSSITKPFFTARAYFCFILSYDQLIKKLPTLLELTYSRYTRAKE